MRSERQCLWNQNSFSLSFSCYPKFNQKLFGKWVNCQSSKPYRAKPLHRSLYNSIVLGAFLGCNIVFGRNISHCLRRAEVSGIKGGIKSNEWLSHQGQGQMPVVASCHSNTRFCNNQCPQILWSAYSSPKHSRRYDSTASFLFYMHVFLLLLSWIMDIVLGKYLFIYFLYLASVVHCRMIFGDLNILQCIMVLISFK